MCAALCASKGAAAAIHEAADSVAPLKVRSFVGRLMGLHEDGYSWAPTGWLVRHAGMLVGELSVYDDEEWHDDDGAPTFIHLPRLQPRALRIVPGSMSADATLLDAFGYNRLTKLKLKSDCFEVVSPQVEALLAALPPLTQLQDLEIADCCGFPSAADFFAPLTRLTRLAFWLNCDREPDESELLPAAMLQSLPQSLQSLYLQYSVEAGSRLTHLTALTELDYAVGVTHDDGGIHSAEPLSAGLPASLRKLRMLDDPQSIALLTKLTRLEELALTRCYDQADPLTPCHLATLPASIRRLVLESTAVKLDLQPASLTQLTALTYFCMDNPDCKFTSPAGPAGMQTPLLLPASLVELRMIQYPPGPPIALQHLTALTFVDVFFSHGGGDVDRQALEQQLSVLPASSLRRLKLSLPSIADWSWLAQPTGLTQLELTATQRQHETELAQAMCSLPLLSHLSFNVKGTSILHPVFEAALPQLQSLYTGFWPYEQAPPHQLPLLQRATQLTALHLSVQGEADFPQLASALAPLTRLAVLEISLLTDSWMLLSDAQAKELGVVLSAMPLQRLTLPTLGAEWHRVPTVPPRWHSVLLEHCGARAKQLLLP
jgi:hypothetical protein